MKDILIGGEMAKTLSTQSFGYVTYGMLKVFKIEKKEIKHCNSGLCFRDMPATRRRMNWKKSRLEKGRQTIAEPLQGEIVVVQIQ